MATEDMMNIAIRVCLIILAAVIVIFLISYYRNPKKTTDMSERKGVEKFNTANPVRQVPQVGPVVIDEQVRKTVRFADQESRDVPATPYAQQQGAGEPAPYADGGSEDYIAVDYNTAAPQQPTTCYPQDRTTPDDLLPKDAANSKWAQVAPAGQGDVKNQNFLSAGFHVGMNTIGTARKNPNLTLRAEPPNPRIAVSPWMNSTIEPDTMRRGLEIV